MINQRFLDLRSEGLPPYHPPPNSKVYSESQFFKPKDFSWQYNQKGYHHHISACANNQQLWILLQCSFLFRTLSQLWSRPLNPPPLSTPKDKNFCKSSKTPDSWRSYQNSLSFFFLTPKYQKSNVFCLKVLSSSQNFLSLIPISYVKCPMYILQNSWQFVICQNSLSSSLTLKQLSIVFIILHNVGPYCSHNPLAVPSPLDCDLHFY